MPGAGKSTTRVRVLALLARVPAGRVATIDVLAGEAGIVPQHITTILQSLSEDERQALPWHRAVAKGGAIGRGPWREAQFARLVREGISVSPAGVVQDMARAAIADLKDVQVSAKSSEPAAAAAPPRLSRSRGMKDRPR